MLGFSFSFLRREGSETEEPDEQGRKEGRKERGKEGRKAGRKEERKEGRHERGRGGKRGNSLVIALGDLRRRERDSRRTSVMDCEAWKWFGGPTLFSMYPH
jgi:hypothetical protein